MRLYDRQRDTAGLAVLEAGAARRAPAGVEAGSQDELPGTAEPEREGAERRGGWGCQLVPEGQRSRLT